MPGQPSTAGANIGLDAMSGRATQSARTTYLMLLTSAPVDGDTMTTLAAKELVAAGYSRQTCAWSAPTGDPAVQANSALITFGPVSVDPASVTHLALVSSASGTSGDFVWWWTADTARDGISGDGFTVAAGALTMQLD